MTAAQRKRLAELGDQVGELWKQDACPVKLKKRIVRAVQQEVLVDLDKQTDTLHFVLHWMGGCHTELPMPKPPFGIGGKTDAGDLELIHEMAGRVHADATIARVLTKLGRRTGAGKRWSQQRVASARTRGQIAGQSKDTLQPDILSLGQVVKQYGVSDSTGRKLVRHGLLTMDQAAPWAPWEMRQSQLDAEPVRLQGRVQGSRRGSLRRHQRHGSLPGGVQQPGNEAGSSEDRSREIAGEPLSVFLGGDRQGHPAARWLALLRAHHPDLVVAGVEDIDITGAIYINPGGPGDAGLAQGAVGIAPVITASHGAHHPLVDHTDAVAAFIRDQDAPVTRGSQVHGVGEGGITQGAAVGAGLLGGGQAA